MTIANSILRTAMTIVGSYGLAVATGFAAARALPLPRAEGAMVALILSVPVMAAGAIFACASPSLRHMMGWMLGLTALLSAVAWLAGPA